MAKQRRTLASDAEERRRAAGGGDAGERAGELAVLAEGGPWIGGAWYWRVDLEQRISAERAAVERGYSSPTRRAGRPVPGVRDYRPTQRWERHRDEILGGGVEARVWAYCPPDEGMRNA